MQLMDIFILKARWQFIFILFLLLLKFRVVERQHLRLVHFSKRKFKVHRRNQPTRNPAQVKTTMMPAVKRFSATTGLQPFSLIRISFIVALSAAALVIAKLVDAYLFCGFNANFFADLPLGVVLFVSYCVMLLLARFGNGKPTTKGGRCCREFGIFLTFVWLLFTFYGIVVVHVFVPWLGLNSTVAYDPFNVCGSRTNENVRSQLSNAMAIFDNFQLADRICKIAVGLAWLVLAIFVFVAWVMFIVLQQATNDPEAGRSAEGHDETIIWVEESSIAEQTLAADGSIDIEDESASSGGAPEAGDRMSEVCSVDVRMENLRNEFSEPGSNC